MLWSAPRSRSTAFFRMMAERGDFTVVHEPFSYLAEFGYTDVARTRVTSAAGLLAVLPDLGSRGHVFAKETTGRRYPEVLGSPEFLAGAVHTFLIRHPRETIASYHAMNPSAPAEKIGFESLHEIFAAVSALNGRSPVVFDAGDLMRRPADVAASAGFAASAGSGASGGSGGTASRRALDVERHPVLGAYLRHHLPYYEMLHARRLTV